MSGASPSLGGFISFVQDVMAPPDYFNPVTSPYVSYSYNFAYEFVNGQLACVPSFSGFYSLYALAVYNLAGDTLVNTAQDGANDPNYPTGSNTKYWQYMRQQYGCNSFVPGVIASTSDEGTSAAYAISSQLNNLTIANLQNLKTPYGRQYLAIAGSWGTVWGLS